MVGESEADVAEVVVGVAELDACVSSLSPVAID